MHLKTLFNRCSKFKSFVFDRADFQKTNGVDSLLITLKPRKNGGACCSICTKPQPIYDHQSDYRLFRFVPLWRIPVYLRYKMRRVDCPTDGVRVEQIPWARGKSPLTHAMELFLARWARRLSWQEVSRCFDVSWDSVYRSVQSVVEYGLKHRSLNGVQAIGVDEIQYGKGHQYMTVV